MKRLLDKIIIKAKSRLLPKEYVFGDSHTEVFNHINKRWLKYKVYQVTRIDGATAMGMVNPNSQTAALPTFLVKIAKLKKSAKLIFLLGEVDVGFLIWHRFHKYNNSVEEQLELSINNYIRFLENLKEQGFYNIKVVSPSLPSIKDENVKTQLIELRREIGETQLERTQLAIEYNARLKEELTKRNICFVDLYPHMINKNTRIVADKYLDENPNEHHLCVKAFSHLIAQNINKCC